jgi:hypothetical protein
MDAKNCTNCNERKRCRDSSLSWVFFILGLLATIAVRVVNVLMHINPIYGKISWYAGVSGFFLFFLYKFNVNRSRMKRIKQQNIVEKMNQEKPLSENDYQLISQMLCALSSNKEKINYLFIFGLSALALIIALYIDFFK